MAKTKRPGAVIEEKYLLRLDITGNTPQSIRAVANPKRTLLKSLPYPLRKLIGDLSNEEKVLQGPHLRREKLIFKSIFPTNLR